MTSKSPDIKSPSKTGVKKKVKSVDLDKVTAKDIKKTKKPASLASARFKALMEKTGAMSGDDALERLDSKKCYSFGNLGLDLAAGTVDRDGEIGFQERSFIEIFGPNNVLKSGTLHKIIRSVQRKGKIAVVLFSEVPDLRRMRRDGVNTKELVILNCWEPDGREAHDMTGERGLSDLLRWARLDEVGLIAIDSVKGLAANIQLFKKGDGKNKEERGIAQSDFGARANLMEKFFNRAKAYCKRASLVMTNQVGDNSEAEFQIGANSRPQTPGGRRKEFEATIRIYVVSEPIKVDTEHDVVKRYKGGKGLHVNYWIVKNRHSRGMHGKKVDVTYLFDRNDFWNAETAFRFAVYADLIVKKGAVYTFQDGKKIKGRDNAIAALEDPQLYKVYKKLLIEKQDMLFSNKEGAERKTVKLAFAQQMEEDEDDDDEQPRKKSKRQTR